MSLIFFSTLYLPLCLYLNMITKGSPPSLFNFSLQYHKLSLIYNTTFSIAYEHSSSFFFLFTKYPGFFLNNPNFYKFCQHFPIQNITESANLRHTWFCQNSAHLLITSKTLLQNIFPNNNLKASLQGELTKYLSASSDTKNICLLVTLPPRQDRFQDNTYVFNNWYQQFLQQNNRPDSTSAENIDSPNFINIEKLYAHHSDKPPMCEILEQYH